MADSVMEVVSPSIAMVAVPQATSEVGKLQAELASLEKQLSVLQAMDDTEVWAKAEATGGPYSDHILDHSLGYAGTTGILAILLTNIQLYALSKETCGPAASSD